MNSNNSKGIISDTDLDNYLMGTLTPEETQAVEEYLMDNPHHIERLKLDMLLKQHIQVRPLRTQYRPVRHTLLPLAAAVLLSLSLMFAPWQTARSPLLQGQSDMLDLAAMRSLSRQSDAQHYTIVPALQQLTVLLSPASFVPQPYRVDVLSDGELLARQTLKPGQDGNLYLNLDATQLPTGTVTFRYQPVDDNTGYQEQHLVIQRSSD